MLSGDNGLLKRAGDARDDTVVGQEKEQVELAYVAAAVKKLGDNVEKKDLQDELDISVGDEKTLVTGTSILNVHFYDTNHNYSVETGTVKRIADGEVEAVLDDIFVALYDDGTLVFSNNEEDIDSSKVNENFGNIKDKVYGDPDGEWCPRWGSYPMDGNITKVDILNTINPTSTAGWFVNLYELQEIHNISKINTSRVTNMSGMFNSCSNLSTLDLSNFDTSKVTNMYSMFFDCGVTTIFVGDGWTTNSVTNGEDMFRCNNLVGQSGTTYDDEHMDYTYAHIDGGASNPGYFTAKP